MHRTLLAVLFLLSAGFVVGYVIGQLDGAQYVFDRLHAEAEARQ